MNSDQKIQELIDKEAIRDVISHYALALDTHDWGLYRSCFAEEVEMDFSASIGTGGPIKITADAWVEKAKPFFESLKATQHIAFPLKIEILGDRAVCISLLHAQHFQPNIKGGDLQKMVGRYENHLIRTERDWKIHRCIQTISWNEGNWVIFEEAARA